MLSKEAISAQTAYITINPSGKFVKSAQFGFDAAGLRPRFLIHVNPGGRIKKEFKRYKLGVFREFLWPKFRQHFGNKESFTNEICDIEIPVTKKVNVLNSDDTLNFIRENNIKYLVNCGAGIFRKKLIRADGLYILNAHAGKLPEYRNMNVVDWALYNGDPVVGTIHLIDEGIDTGPVLVEKELNLSGHKDLISAREAAFDQVIRMAGNALLDFASGNITPRVQPVSGSNWYLMHSYFKQKLNEKLSNNL
jgi:methionyl-tRNA formyltransferase